MAVVVILVVVLLLWVVISAMYFAQRAKRLVDKHRTKAPEWPSDL